MSEDAYTGGDAHHRCGLCPHTLGEHNRLVGCTACSCLANPSEARRAIPVTGITGATAVVQVAVRPYAPGLVVYTVSVPHDVEPVLEVDEVVRILRAAAEQLEANPGNGVGFHAGSR